MTSGSDAVLNVLDLFLSRKMPMSLRGVAEETGLSADAAQNILDRLVAKGYLVVAGGDTYRLRLKPRGPLMVAGGGAPALDTVLTGLARDLSQLLFDIQGNLVRMDPDVGDPRGRVAARRAADSACRQAQQILGSLMWYASPKPAGRKVLQVGAVVEDAVRLGLSGAQTQSEIRLPGLWPVVGDEGVLTGVFLNTIVRAREVMKGRGRITVDGRNLTVTAGEKHPVGPGRYVCVEVRDAGPGDGDGRVCRERGLVWGACASGTLSALSASAGLLRGHGGAVSVEDSPGVGTCVRIYLQAFDRSGRAPGSSDRGLTSDIHIS